MHRKALSVLFLASSAYSPTGQLPRRTIAAWRTERRTPIRALAAAFGSVSLLACGEGTSVGVEVSDKQIHRLVGSAEAAALALEPCDGVIVRGHPVHFEHSGAMATPYSCFGSNGRQLRTELRDHSGAVSWDAMRLADAVAFRTAKQRMDPELRKRMERATDAERVLVDVWLTIPEGGLPDREHLHGLSKNDNERETTLFRQRIEAHVRRILQAEKIEQRVLRLDPQSPGLRGRAPLLMVEATPEQIRELAQLDAVTALSATWVEDKGTASSEAWYDIDRIAPMIANAGWDGSGVIVADIYGSWGIADNTELGVASGSCEPTVGGPNYKCFCPPLAANATSTGNHMQDVLGFVKNSNASLRGGTAPAATTIVGNAAGSSPNGCGGVTLATDWAIDEGVDVINRSAGISTEYSRYSDWVASVPPYVLTVAAAGNSGNDDEVGGILRNGIIVGGANDHQSVDRTALTMYSGSQSGNPLPGFELPHVVAPAVNLWTTPNASGNPPKSVTGTSFAAPQVSGIAASLMSGNFVLRSWPEAVLAILMAGADENVSGVWPVNLEDGVDDEDGAGAVNAEYSQLIAKDLVHGGAAPARSAFDVHTVLASAYPVGSTYAEEWVAYAAPGDTLRAVSVMGAQLSCTEGDADSCSSKSWPRHTLTIWRRSGDIWIVADSSSSFDSNYQVAAATNDGTSTRNYYIKVTFENWDGLSSGGLAVAWSSDT